MLIVGHGVILSYISRHVLLSAWLAGGLITVVALKHVGLLDVLLASLRARNQRARLKRPGNGAARPTSEGSN